MKPMRKTSTLYKKRGPGIILRISILRSSHRVSISGRIGVEPDFISRTAPTARIRLAGSHQLSRGQVA